MGKSHITVIVPCYNGYRYISKCLDSLENQTFRNFTVIIVDDCSMDNTYEQLLEYQKNTKLDFEIIRNKENIKLAKTRQVGVLHTKTEWLCFCDCDDWYEYDFLEKMLKTAEKEKVDAVMCHFNYAYADGNKKYLTGLNILSNKSSKKEFLAYAPMSMCRFIFKKKLFDNLVIPAINNAEDGAVTPQLLVRCKKIAIIHEGLYNYFIRHGSLSNTLNPCVYYDFLEAQEVLEKTVGLEFKEECEFLAIKNFGYGAILNGLKSNIPINEMKKDYSKFLSKYPSWGSNKYIRSLSKKRKIFLKILKYNNFVLLKLYAKMHYLLLEKQC